MPSLVLRSITSFLRRHCPHRIEEPSAMRAAVAVVLAPGRSGDPELLLIKRAERHGDPWSGQMALPGGRQEPGDSSLLHTVRRETHEETGIELTEDQVLGELDDLHPRTSVLPPIVVRPFVFGLPHQPVVQISDEVTLHLWVPLSELRNSAAQSSLTVRGKRLEVSSYVIGPHVIWGMTEHIIKPIIELAD
ncbi:MAG: CoA pyrophosphatase [Gemmatimonadota bacterium]|nr:MAG: CoA pyrophosphatase [Gemmatimonadota bacterium]